MAERKIQYGPGRYFHVYNRGVARQNLFRNHENYLYLLRLIKKVTEDIQVTVIAYCLLPNHYHWLLRQDGDTPTYWLARRVFGSYSQAFNRSYGRSGTLFQGRSRTKPVLSQGYLHRLCCYIHANPVKHGFVMTPEMWPYSNYAEWIGIRNGTLWERNFMLEHFGSVDVYQNYVGRYLAGSADVPPAIRAYFQGLI